MSARSTVFVAVVAGQKAPMAAVVQHHTLVANKDCRTKTAVPPAEPAHLADPVAQEAARVVFEVDFE